MCWRFVFITLRATRDLPLPILWGIAAVLNVLAIETGYAVVDGYATNLVFFVTGAVAARQIFNGAAFYEDRAHIILPITLLAFIGNGLMFYFGFNSFPGGMLAAGLIMSYTVILFMSVVARRVSLPWLAFAGKYSIVIYLSFFIPMVVTRLALQKTGLITHPDLVSLIVWLVAAISPLIVFLLVRNTPLRFVYQRPSWVRFPKPRHPQPAE